MPYLILVLLCALSFINIPSLSAKNRKKLPNQAHHQIKAYDRTYEHTKRKLTIKQKELLEHYQAKKELEQEETQLQITDEP